MDGVLLSTAYFPSIQYVSLAAYFKGLYIEQFEHFNKQTYRNRCVILGANGVAPLIVPVVKGRGPKVKIRDLKISYDTEWQRNHWRTIFSAYGSSPYFEYYADDMVHFFRKKYPFLFDYNLEILEKIFDLLEVRTTINLTSGFETIPENILNLRDKITPKISTAVEIFSPVPYTQVFSDRTGFVPDLSILDLLFNEGPNSSTILASNLKRGSS